MKPMGEQTREWAKANNITCWYESEVDSTNKVAYRDFDLLGNENRELILYLCDQQLAGRGRSTHTWTSPPLGTSLLSTWSFSTEKSLQPIFAPLVGWAFYSAAKETWPAAPWSLKAPNDLYLGSKKVAGILIESISFGSIYRTLIGIGFNVMAAPQDVETATCLRDSLESTPTPEQWQNFLTFLKRNLLLAIKAGYESDLSLESCDKILRALNQHPKFHYKAMGTKGQLQSDLGWVNWYEL